MSEKKTPLWLVSYRLSYRQPEMPVRDVVETIREHPGAFFARLTINGHKVLRIYSATWIPDDLRERVASLL